ncbi:replication initiation negative regulator SeqA [Agarivorans sp. MS3-6]|uniref:replication initiation negative regulator SeqA n=1 Tax=Agarivorans sp. TSD2052 TaxID=2937286 RepID=UPI00200E76FB|nr:replication initiation negative regulator SeqA [Agarivorans sp. TSD2052]UPW20474.1 replication initiation negative regulator SeqA [Agarivorans sp. TSD2052]
MKTIEIEEDLYLYIAGQTKHIGENASDILRRLLNVDGIQTLDEPLVPPLIEQQEQEDETVKLESTMTSVPTDFANLLNKFDFDKIAVESSSTKRFLVILSQLYHVDSQRFIKACVIKGSKREYFSQSKEALLASGKTTKPQAIPETPFWVITNTNTARKRYILQHVASEMGLEQSHIDRLCEAV